MESMSSKVAGYKKKLLSVAVLHVHCASIRTSQCITLFSYIHFMCFNTILLAATNYKVSHFHEQLFVLFLFSYVLCGAPGPAGQLVVQLAVEVHVIRLESALMETSAMKDAEDQLI